MFKVVRSFSGRGFTHSEGKLLESIPNGVDWIRAGFVRPIGKPPIEHATAPKGELRTIKGIGAKTLKKLEAAGITTPAALKAANPAELAKKIGVDVERVKKWQA